MDDRDYMDYIDKINDIGEENRKRKLSSYGESGFLFLSAMI